MDKKTDRRVRRTRALLQQSLIRLMAEKEIKDITVKELTELADITRGTFYLHYSDIYDVLRSIEYEMFVEFNEILNLDQKKSTPEAVLTDIFLFLERYRDIAKVMMGPHGDMAFVNHLKNLVRERIYQALEKKKTDCEYDYAEAFVISGCIGVVETWLYHPSPLPPREIARICCDMLAQGLDLT
ncbi:MAG: TetR/AcrR family transcriptional regulator C-terminal domain-containing protein [Lachnospiraceae bacterium]|nr:TetR/AcrR family transcriptional regulator C-terminal domain-containing protein [Lachnospiraceae bacterium]MCM1238078.1 TetR/AcrR family transcriptional regulator C-terminal domain-containing protein [Lachnospiraceae bacterium]